MSVVNLNPSTWVWSYRSDISLYFHLTCTSSFAGGRPIKLRRGRLTLVCIIHSVSTLDIYIWKKRVVYIFSIQTYISNIARRVINVYISHAWTCVPRKHYIAFWYHAWHDSYMYVLLLRTRTKMNSDASNLLHTFDVLFCSTLLIELPT